MGKELQVVTDKQQAAGTINQSLLETLYGRQVKVVRRLVHDNQVRAADDTEREQHFAKLAGTGVKIIEQSAGPGIPGSSLLSSPAPAAHGKACVLPP
ncbi:MAG: hypothetical protein AB2L14_36075 [Candidatus Xenobiia bacterium LiM19]